MCAPGVHADPALQRLVAAWPLLSPAVRTAMLALLPPEATCGSEKD